MLRFRPPNLISPIPTESQFAKFNTHQTFLLYGNYALERYLIPTVVSAAVGCMHLLLFKKVIQFSPEVIDRNSKHGNIHFSADRIRDLNSTVSIPRISPLPSSAQRHGLNITRENFHREVCSDSLNQQNSSTMKIKMCGIHCCTSCANPLGPHSTGKKSAYRLLVKTLRWNTYEKREHMNVNGRRILSKTLHGHDISTYHGACYQHYNRWMFVEHDIRQLRYKKENRQILKRDEQFRSIPITFTQSDCQKEVEVNCYIISKFCMYQQDKDKLHFRWLWYAQYVYLIIT